MIVAVPAAAMVSTADAATPARTVANPTTSAPSHPVMAYIHDAKRGEVVIMTGSKERTVRDPELVRRLLTPPKPNRKAKSKHATLAKPKRTAKG